jgi:hypothetical protein
MTSPSLQLELLTLDLKPRQYQASKPAELIQVRGHEELTLNARRMITVLWHQAHLQGIKEGKDYTAEIDDLKPDGHKGYEMVEEGIESLMRTLLVVRNSNGGTIRVQFLGGNDLDDPRRQAGVLTYSFDKRLIQVLQDSRVWGKIQIPVLMAFSSRYAVSLYENIAQMAGLKIKQYHDYSLEEFRELLGIPPGKYITFGALNKHVIKRAVEEINGLANFTVSLLPIKQGKKVTSLKVCWSQKSEAELQQTFAELNRPKVGRRARIANAVEYVAEVAPSSNRIRRKAGSSLRSPKPVLCG